ncbi:hypothetical protein HNR60_002685 [Rhodopseudomonas rhenobacensis]|uniref:Uncharacterized protein n=1 Tax=Rhodopseudomonas rhenobacensis TaxID=87461 RepID=A0A7W8DZE2_9BRAD|nr:hypothetical protein [Rhodopseudomonas rhenobacensis]MBB5047928.1 hypothetical protein [Rhodopseudomonas rhenobacensis]
MANRMIIGGPRQVDEASPTTLRFENSDIAFKLVATYLTALHSFATTTEVYNNGRKGALPWAIDDVALFDGAACDIRLKWSPRETVAPMMRNVWPSKIDFTSYPAVRIPQNTPLDLGVLEHFIFSLGQSILTTFVENQKPFLTATYGKVANWPSVWNFARVVRNAMAHGGKIRIDDKAQVQWQRLSYSEADNGKPIINIDLWPADLFILIKEMEKAIP